MNQAGIPVKIPTPFASSAPGGQITNPLPVPAQPGGHASWSTGFPPPNFVDPLAGGTPPWGADANGVLFMISAWLQWLNANAITPYDAIYQAAVGGYPKGARVPSATTDGLVWVSTVDANVTNPDAGGAGWLQVGSFVTQSITGVGLTNVTVPDFATEMFARCWGGGGGGSGSTPGPTTVGSSGAGGGRAEGWFPVLTGQVIACTVGTGGAAAASGNPAGDGGTSTVVNTSTGATLLTATGGHGGSQGPNVGGNGTIGQFLFQGGAGMDLDGNILAGSASTMNAPGGDGAGGGSGGNVNSSGNRMPAVQPGGGGGANYFIVLGQGGAAGQIDLMFRIG